MIVPSTVAAAGAVPAAVEMASISLVALAGSVTLQAELTSRASTEAPFAQTTVLSAAVPFALVVSDATLAEMAQLMPTNDAEFLKVSGVGFTKLNKYGAYFMNAIRNHLTS